VQNAFIDSFNGRLRDELLNETLFSSLAHARATLATWQVDYNTVRPHSSLGNPTPMEYANRSSPASQGGGPLRAIGGLRAPRRCSIEPARFKWRPGSTSAWMRTRAQVNNLGRRAERSFRRSRCFSRHLQRRAD
jgi:putative transposase